MARETEWVRFEDFSGGLDTTTAHHLLAMNTSPDIVNFWPMDRFGELVKRGGSVYLNTDAANAGDGALAAAPITGLTKAYFRAGTQYTLANCANNIYRITDAGVKSDITTSTLAGTGLETYFEMLNDNVYIVNGNTTDLYMKYDGSGAIASANATKPATVTSLTYLFFHPLMGRMILIGGGAYGNNAYYSNVLLPESNQGFEPFVTNEGDDLVCGCSTSTRAVMFKRRSIFAWYGSGPSEFAKPRLYSNHGTDAPRSVVVDGDIVYYFGSDLLFHALEGNKPVTIGNKVKKTTQAIAKAMRSKVCGTKYFDYILWAYSDNGTTNNRVLAYHTQTGAWTFFWGLNVAQFFTQIGAADDYRVMFGESGSTGRVNKFDTTTSDNGSKIYYTWMSPAMSPGMGWPLRVDWQKIHIWAKADNTTINWSLDAEASSRRKNGTFTYAASGAVYGDGSAYGDGSVYGGADFTYKNGVIGLSGSESRLVISGNDTKAVRIRRIALSYKQCLGEGWVG